MIFRSYKDINSTVPIWLRFQHRFKQRATEWLSSAQLLWLGIVLIISNSLIDRFSFSTVRDIVVNETVWGLLLILLGLLRLTGLAVNGARIKVTPWIRLLGAGIGFLVFTLITMGFAVTVPFGTWSAAWPVFAVMELINVFRAAQDTRELKVNA